MSFLNDIKNTAKKAKDAITGDGAKVILATDGQLTPGGTVTTTFTVESTGNKISANGAVIDLVGVDPDSKDYNNLLSKAGSLFSKGGGHRHTFEVASGFSVKAGETKRVEGKFEVPKNLDTRLKWLIRGRVQAVGNDPDTGFHAFKG